LVEDRLLVAIFGDLYGGTYSPGRPGIRPPLRYWNEHLHGKPTDQAKLDIRADRLLMFQAGDIYTIVPLVDLQLLERSDFAQKLCRLRGHESRWDFVQAHCNRYPVPLLFPRHRKPDVQLPLPHDIGNRGGWGIPEQPYTRAARYDLQIAGPSSVRLFHAHGDQLFVSIEFDYLNWTREQEQAVTFGRVKPPERQLRTGKLPADFTERFAAYTSAKRDYLVTTNGKVYMAVPKGEKEVEVSAVWNDPTRKVFGVVQDQANDAVYGWGFVTDSAAPERFYVKLDPKPIAVTYKRSVPLGQNRADAYVESYECVRAFRKAGGTK
jgi:hypothetical protein